MPAVVKHFSFSPVTDRDILEWLGEQTNESASVREAVRFYLQSRNGPTLADVLAEIRGLPARILVVARPADDSPEGDEPPEAVANLSGLLDRLESGGIG